MKKTSTGQSERRNGTMSVKSVKAPSLRERTSWKKALRRDWHLYLLLLVPIVLVVLFNYGAYPGLRMVFYDYKPARGYEGSKWVGLETFAKVFRDKDFLRALKKLHYFQSDRSGCQLPDAHCIGFDAQ